MKSYLLLLMALLASGCINLPAQVIHYATGKYLLTDADKRLLDTLVERKDSNFVYVVAGHTDNVGKDNNNMRLSIRRVAEVYDYLKSNGIDTSRIDRTYLGSTKPLVSNSTATGRMQNRRTEIAVAVTVPEQPDTIAQAPAPERQRMTVRKLQNGIIIDYTNCVGCMWQEPFIPPDDDNCGMSFIDNAGKMQKEGISTVAVDDKILASQLIYVPCNSKYRWLDSLRGVMIKMPVTKKFFCGTDKLKLYTEVDKGANKGKWKPANLPFTIETTDTTTYLVIASRNYNSRLNFAYDLHDPCFNTTDEILKVKGVSPQQITIADTAVNAIYTAEKDGRKRYIMAVRKDAGKDEVVTIDLSKGKESVKSNADTASVKKDVVQFSLSQLRYTLFRLSYFRIASKQHFFGKGFFRIRKRDLKMF